MCGSPQLVALGLHVGLGSDSEAMDYLLTVLAILGFYLLQDSNFYFPIAGVCDYL